MDYVLVACRATVPCAAFRLFGSCAVTSEWRGISALPAKFVPCRRRGSLGSETKSRRLARDMAYIV